MLKKLALIILLSTSIYVVYADSSSLNWLTKGRADTLYIASLTCADNEILKYDLATGEWACDTDLTGGGGGGTSYWYIDSSYMKPNETVGGQRNIDIDTLNATELCFDADNCISGWSEVNLTGATDHGHNQSLNTTNNVRFGNINGTGTTHYWGNGSDTFFYFNGVSNTGIIQWDESLDNFRFLDDMFVVGSLRLMFKNLNTYITSTTTNILDIISPETINLNAPNTKVNNNLTVDKGVYISDLLSLRNNIVNNTPELDERYCFGNGTNCLPSAGSITAEDLLNQSLNTTDHVRFSELNVTEEIILSRNKRMYFDDVGADPAFIEFGAEEAELLIYSAVGGNTIDLYAFEIQTTGPLFVRDNYQDAFVVQTDDYVHVFYVDTVKNQTSMRGNFNVSENITAQYYCNNTACHTITEFLKDETGGGNPSEAFNQSLNTTNDVRFNSFNVSSNSILYGNLEIESGSAKITLDSLNAEGPGNVDIYNADFFVIDSATGEKALYLLAKDFSNEMLRITDSLVDDPEFKFTSDPYFGINVESPGAAIHADGNAIITGTFTLRSNPVNTTPELDERYCFGNGTNCLPSGGDGGNPFTDVDNVYIYNNSGVLTLNETKLNATIDLRDDVGGGGGDSFPTTIGFTDNTYNGNLTNGTFTGLDAYVRICQVQFNTSWYPASQHDLKHILHNYNGNSTLAFPDNPGATGCWIWGHVPGDLQNIGCNGAQTSSGTYYGSFWNFNGKRGGLGQCNQNKKLCCSY